MVNGCFAAAGLLAEGVSPDRAAAHFSEFMAFVYGGWSAVLQNAVKIE